MESKTITRTTYRVVLDSHLCDGAYLYEFNNLEDAKYETIEWNKDKETVKKYGKVHIEIEEKKVKVIELLDEEGGC